LTENWARVVRAVLRWFFVLLVTIGGVYVALRLPLFGSLPGVLSSVLSIEFVGLVIVFSVEVLNRRMGLGQFADELIRRFLLARPEAEPGTTTVPGD
jgi:hypothetical protein